MTFQKLAAGAVLMLAAAACSKQETEEVVGGHITTRPTSLPALAAEIVATAPAAATESAALDLKKFDRPAVAGPIPMPKLDGEVRVTRSGLKYIEITPGAGAEVQKGQTMVVEYIGWFEDGKMFDSSRTRGAPFTFVLGAKQVIKAWDLGVAEMKIGEKRRLICPADVAYGPDGQPPTIPPNATLMFDVELLGAK